MRRYAKPLIFLGIVTIIVTVVILILYPEWWYVPGGILLLVRGVLVAVIPLAEKLLSFVMKWLKLEKQPTTWDEFPLKGTTPQAICEGLGRYGGRVRWIERGCSDVRQLERHKRVVITGRAKLGKTREAAELMARAVEHDLINEERIFKPGPTLSLLDEDSLRAAVRRGLDATTPALLFVDDLPRHYSDEGLKRLSAALEIMERCKTLYVVATARSTHLSAAHLSWLKTQGFHTLELADLERTQALDLVRTEAEATFGLQLDEGAKAALVEHFDGTPDLPLVALRRLRAEGQTQVKEAEARHVAEKSLADAWEAVRANLKKRQAATEPLIKALAAFHATRLKTDTVLVLGYAESLWDGARRWGRAKALREALELLGGFDVKAGEVIDYPELLVEGLTTLERARQRLEDYLVGRRRVLQRIGLRRLDRGAKAQSRALFSLSNDAFDQKDWRKGIDLCSAALRAYPISWIFNNRGVAYAELKEHDEAIADFNRALALDPKYAQPYNNRGLTYDEQGEFDKAMSDYRQAIALDPKDAQAYYNRGLAYAKREKLQDAMRDFDRAIALAPNFFRVYQNRGVAYMLLEEWGKAVNDFNKVILLGPEGIDKAKALIGRAWVLIGLSRLVEAHVDLEGAERLEIDDPEVLKHIAELRQEIERRMG